MDWIERLRRKPPHVKVQVAFGTALSVTLAIAFVWSLTLPLRLAEPDAQPAEAVSADADSSFISGVQEAFSGVAGALRGALTPMDTEDGEMGTSAATSTDRRDGNTLDLEAARQRGGTVTEVEWERTDEDAASTTPFAPEEDPDGTAAATGSPGTTSPEESAEQEPRVILIGTTSVSGADERSE